MMGRWVRIFASCLMLQASWPAAFPSPAVAQSTEAAQGFNTQQLDALLAPIALYPDPLLTQILMASTYPLQVVEAARWVEQPANKSLTGDALAKALEAQPWDPSVKSLVPFPQVLAMMNSNLDWMQQLGYAFADQQAAVMDSVQRLRRQAQSSGNLQSTSQQVVQTEQQTIIIEPAQTDVVYVPVYNPIVVYGGWPYPAYPPVYFPPPVGYPYGAALATGIAFGIGVAITASLWNWARPVWGGGYVNVNVNRYNNINVNRTSIRSNVWQPNRAGGRPAGLARPPVGPVGAPARPVGLPAGAIGRPQVSVPGNVVRPPAARPAPGGGQFAPGNRPTPVQRPSVPINRPTPQVVRPAPQGAFSGINNGRQVQQFGQRGAQSRSFGAAGGHPGGARVGGRR